MSYGAVRKQLSQQATTAHQPDPSKCHADHCPCRGTVSFDGGRFCCAAHAFAKADDWPKITEKLHELYWLVAFMDDIQRFDQNPGKNTPDWRDYATKFWGGQDEFCVPHPKEECLPYQLRMRGELQYRLGLTKRPAPRIPEPVKSRGNAGRLLGRRAA